jgi:hypothetical protein
MDRDDVWVNRTIVALVVLCVLLVAVVSLSRHM